MYLKSIEIQGFKSFANKTVLDFSKGITGIVGPNGSGKSNISDAVRWVLGEQKVKQLRGSSMQDVIFSGTKLRRPQSFAYVAITLSNEDHSLNLGYPEVTIARRLYRSGESEYRINGTECRLRDINELFYDTGIGKEGYSIIGQGQIDKILSGKAEERRALFDEAVGIVKFKRRKAQAEQKLTEEHGNLTRVTDILHELELQVGPLEKQAEQAKSYLTLRDSLISEEASLYLREVSEIEGTLSEVTENQELVQKDLANLRRESMQLSGEYDRISGEIQTTEETIRNTESAIKKADLLRSNLSGQIDVLQEQIHAEENNRRHYEDRIQTLKETEFSTIASLEDDLSRLSYMKEKLLFILENGDAEVDKENVSLDLELIRNAKSEAEAVVRSCRGEDYALEIRPYQEEKPAAALPGGEISSQLDERRNSLKVLEEEILRLHQSCEESSQNLQSLLRDREDQIRGMEQRRRERDQERSRFEALQNLAERYEGFGHAVKSVMDRKNSVHGIHGTVADLIPVPKKYETAMETALGSAVQNIVTEDEKTAKQMIQYLKERRLGRATFLPLDNIRGRRDERCVQASHLPGALGLASDLIEAPERYQNLSEYLLGRVLVVDSMDHALEIQRQNRQSLRIVTLEGELLNPGGSISGGAYRNSSNLMSRKRELEELRVHIEKLEREVQERKAAVQESTEKSREIQQELARQQAEISEQELKLNNEKLAIASQLNIEYSTLTTRTDFVTEDVHRLASQLSEAFEERIDQERDSLASDGLLKEKQEKIVSLETLIRETGEDAERAAGSIRSLEQKKAELSEQQKSFFGKKDELSEKLLSMEKESMRVQNLRAQKEQRLEALSQYMLEEYQLSYSMTRERYSEKTEFSLSELRKSVQSLKAEIKALGPVNLDAIEQFKEIGERYRFLKQQYEDLVASEEKLQTIIHDLDHGMRKQFQENFARIQTEFNNVFRILFGGGQGRIELETGEQDVLRAGIHIIAEPPGKKLQNMMQLSGGEKALTAISLLFAIQKLKPSPFCLLDEIEAALDDSNVVRFADYLHQLQYTQFIVITHRRGTMERTDRLFGITMQEKGISALVSVDLVQDQLE